jgi:hypothetical protein
VPINVPALALSIGEDDVKTDGELVNHGISNALSGVLGTVPNYLCEFGVSIRVWLCIDRVYSFKVMSTRYIFRLFCGSDASSFLI